MTKNKTVIITAGNRGGGFALSKTFAQNGANVVMIAEQSDLVGNENPLSSEHSMVIPIDFTDEKQIKEVVQATHDRFGSIDILINNFSIFNFKNMMDTTPEMFHRVMSNVFATLFFSKMCQPYLQDAANPHIINISPPLDMEAAQSACTHHLLFSISKYGMSFSTLGMAEEFKPSGIAVNSLWQERPIATKTLTDNFDNKVVQGSNRPEVYAEAAYLISCRPAKEFTGNYCIDEDILRESNIDPTQYAVNSNAVPVKDIFLLGVNYELLKTVL